MNKRKKILLLFPDGVGIRNYLYSEVFKEMENDLVLFHAFDAQTEQKIQELTEIQDSRSIPKYTESLKEKFLRELICLSRLKHNAALVGNETILTNWKKNHKGFFKQLFYKCIELVSHSITSYERILKLEKKYQEAIRVSRFYKEVREIVLDVKPAKLFCSHQRGLQCAPIFAAAHDLGIETITVIYSWDNLPKARMALQADKYLVWSDYMQQELKLYYPEIKDSQIFVTGTPQFECYQKTANIIPRAEFYATYNLDLNKKIICYSGDDIKTSPDDPKYLEDLACELADSGLDTNYQILFRRCPVDVTGRYEPIIKKYPGLIKDVPPQWNFDNSKIWTTIFPLREDVKLLVSTAYYSDVVINVGSTMAFDFAMFQKPCIYINYDQENKLNPNWTVKTIYNFQHFKSMTNSSAVLWWNKKEDLKILVQEEFNKEIMYQWKETILSENKNVSLKIRDILKIQ